MGDRMAVMNDGRLQQVGEPLELYHRPANLFVADFIGDPSMNFYHGTREGDRFVHDAFEYELDDDVLGAVDDRIGDGDDLTLGIRPEDVILDEVGETVVAGGHQIEMDALVVEPMGDENVVHLQFPGREGTGDDLVAVVAGRQHVTEGETATVGIPSAAIHLFDTSTGEAVHNRRLETEEAARQV